MKTLVRLLGAMTIAAVLLGLASTPASAARRAPVCDRWPTSYTFYSVMDHTVDPPTGVADRMVMGVNGASTALKAQAIVARFDPYAVNQQWQSRICNLAGTDYLQFRNLKSQLCLDKSEDTPNANGNLVYQYTCTGTNNQLWRRQSQGGSIGNWKQLKNLAAGRCLDIHYERWVTGQHLVVWDCATSSAPSRSQQWNTY
ncbi:hypothetical protein Ade02nite_80100 [Paractinoplanes deccanensis]|uniref:Ricin B lectin domain-containing protein n=1 Tax=Paractinoplanes deccanensis TaxID=113561 RepID=A0ABQ3YHB7_9ACTN|nr:RICIN domain-containing protein [Actinoplanes deccanensis]GID79369.1 hypothetical protein Ade02nite_80100 [Actinoplanes deccanensis]